MSPTVTGGYAAALVFSLLGAILLVVLSQLLLPWANGRLRRTKSATANQAHSFFEIPFITWYLLHFGVAIVGILAVVLLAADSVLDKAGAGTLLGSLFGYVLGAAGSRSSQSTATDKPATPAPPAAPISRTAISPEQGPAGTPAVITGPAALNAFSAKFGDEPAKLTLVAGVGALVVVPALPATEKPGPVDVTLLEKDGTELPAGKAKYTYTSDGHISAS